jgi:hypothetical protein
MLLLNFAHPLIEDHITTIQTITGQTIDRVINLPSQIDTQQPLIPQVIALADQAGLSPTEWQTLPLLVNPPSLNHIAITLLTELHGRCGYFPACLRLRPVPESAPPRFEVAEIINLQAVRDEARSRRSNAT